jgi:alpha-beta hydrolase superfamily lysophospholipase
MHAQITLRSIAGFRFPHWAYSAGRREGTATVHRDVSFVSQGVTLRGTVYIPSRAPIIAAAVWVDGSGEMKRNPGLGEFLARSGLALLTYDKRGIGKSGGVYAGPEVGANNVSAENLTLLADDAAAALQSLSTEELLHGIPLGLLAQVRQVGSFHLRH